MNCEKNLVGNCETKKTDNRYFCYQPQCQYEYLTTTQDNLPQELWGMFHPDSLITYYRSAQDRVEEWEGMGANDHLRFRLDGNDGHSETWYLTRNFRWYEKAEFAEPFINKWEDHAEKLGY